MAPRTPSAPLLDHLRWLAAAAVLLSHVRNLVMVDHAQLRSPGSLIDAFYFASGFGHVAVVVFFVLSGALVGERACTLAREADFVSAWRGFVVDRFCRVAIVFWPALLLSALCLAAAAAIGTASPLLVTAGWDMGWQPPLPHDLDWRPWLATALLANGLGVDTVRIDGPLWSLACEWTCYVFAAAGVAAWRRAWTGTTLLAVAYAVLLLLASAWHATVMLAAAGTWLVGLAAGQVARRRPLRSPTAWLAASAIALFGLAAARVWAWPDLAIAAVLAPVLMHARAWRRVPLAALGHALAARSFSLYAVHAPLTILLLASAQRSGVVLHRGNGDAVSIAIVVGLCLACIAVAWTFAALTERRTPQLRAWLQRGHRRSAVASPA